MTKSTPGSLSSAERREFKRLEGLKEARRARREAYRKIDGFYPDTGPLRRELYPDHTAFFRAGATHRERLMMAANRVGKTEGIGGYETTLHLTGDYPRWWEGRRFDRPVRALVAGDTARTTRDIIQAKLLGPSGARGTGLIPFDAILRTTAKAGAADAVDTAQIRHAGGGASLLAFRSFDQGREAFQGTEQDLIWLDEEPPMAVYTECLIRTMTTDGLVMITFTPLNGMSDVVLAFTEGAADGSRDMSKYLGSTTWDRVPHLSAKQKAGLMDSIPPHQRDARSKGMPALGSGAIYPVPESDILCDPFDIPEHWPRAYGLDVGWNRTAAIWGAVDRESDVIYLYAEHYRGQAEPSIHADAIRARGSWIPGAIDPAARGRAQADGRALLTAYLDLGLTLTPADNAVEAGLHGVWQRLSSGRIKVFRSCQNWLGEYRLYRRDEAGRVVKQRDHLMDATRYLVMTGLGLARTRPADAAPPRSGTRPGGDGWLGR